MLFLLLAYVYFRYTDNLLLNCVIISNSVEEFSEEFKGKAAAFSRTLRGLEDRAKKCESLKILVSIGTDAL